MRLRRDRPGSQARAPQLMHRTRTTRGTVIATNKSPDVSRGPCHKTKFSDAGSFLKNRKHTPVTAGAFFDGFPLLNSPAEHCVPTLVPTLELTSITLFSSAAGSQNRYKPWYKQCAHTMVPTSAPATSAPATLVRAAPGSQRMHPGGTTPLLGHCSREETRI